MTRKAATSSGWRRGESGLDEIAEMKGYTSPRLGVRFEPGEGPDSLKIIGLDGAPFASYVELFEDREAERQRAEAERLRAEAERLRAENESQRADAEGLRGATGGATARAGRRARVTVPQTPASKATLPRAAIRKPAPRNKLDGGGEHGPRVSWIRIAVDC